jgi:hypothetical protein
MNILAHKVHFNSKVWFKLALIFLPAFLILALEFSLFKAQSALAAVSRDYLDQVVDDGFKVSYGDLVIFNESTHSSILSSNLGVNNSIEAEDLTPTSWWPGDGNADDAIGSHNGTAYGVTYPAGKINQAFEFDGVSQSVDIPGVGDFGSNPFTLSFWLYAKSSGSGIYLIGKSYPDAGLGWDVRLNSQSISVVGVNGWGVNITSDSVVTPNAWHHIAIAASDLTGNSVKLYIDGDLQGSCGRQTISSTTNPLRFAMTTGFGGYPFTGLVDEVKLFDRALGEDEIMGLTTAFVDADANGAATGLSWTDAYTNVQDALIKSPGYDIWVAEGVYYPDEGSGQTDNDPTSSFNMTSTVAIYGGFDPDNGDDDFSERDWQTYTTVLSGDLDHNDSTDAHGVLTSTNGIAGTNAYHVVTASGSSITETSVLDGFYITGGNASGSSPYNDGGGLWIGNNASPTLKHLVVSGNYASLDGGGARIYYHANPSFSNVTFTGNHSVRDGGGLRITDSSQPSFINVLISGNKTNAFGAGISDAYSNISLVNVTIADNYAEQGYGGVWSFQSTVVFTNCIVWGNNSSQIESAGIDPSVNYSIVQGGFTGVGNIDADPLFASPLSYSASPTSLGNYRLKYNSPAIETGNTSSISETLDLDGKDRIVDGDNNGSSVVDMGAYEWQRYLLTVNEVGNGSVVKDPDQAGYTTHDSVVVTATAASGWNFTGWSGDITSNINPLQLSMENTTTLTATFTQKSYPLYINVVGEGEVAKDPDLSVYLSGSAVTLTATADTGWSFTGWSGDVISTTNPLELSIATTTTLTATFTQNSYPLNINIVGEGEVNKNPSLSSYPHGTPVTLTATADTGWSFNGWSGDVISSTNPLELSIATTTTLTATFTHNSYPININVIGEGEVTKNPNLSSYLHGAAVTLTATADPGWSFIGWTGDIVSSANPLLTTIQSTTTLTATFSQNAFPLTIDIVGEGSVTKAPNLSNYPYGTLVTLTATADPAWFFAGWRGDVNSNQNPLVTTVTSTTAITATFDTYSAFLPTTIR